MAPAVADGLGRRSGVWRELATERRKQAASSAFDPGVAVFGEASERLFVFARRLVDAPGHRASRGGPNVGVGVVCELLEREIAHENRCSGLKRASHRGPFRGAAVAQRIRDEFEISSASLLKRAKGVTMSAGVASLKEQTPPDADQLVARADAAVYKAKETGRNRISVAVTSRAA